MDCIRFKNKLWTRLTFEKNFNPFFKNMVFFFNLFFLSFVLCQMSLFRISSFSRFVTECCWPQSVSVFESVFVSSPCITLLCYQHRFGGWGLQKRWFCTQPSYLQASISGGDTGGILGLRTLCLMLGFQGGHFLKQLSMFE